MTSFDPVLPSMVTGPVATRVYALGLINVPEGTTILATRVRWLGLGTPPSALSCRDWDVRQGAPFRKGVSFVPLGGSHNREERLDLLKADDLSVQTPTRSAEGFRRSPPLSSRRFRWFRIRSRLRRGRAA